MVQTFQVKSVYEIFPPYRSTVSCHVHGQPRTTYHVSHPEPSCAVCQRYWDQDGDLSSVKKNLMVHVNGTNTAFTSFTRDLSHFRMNGLVCTLCKERFKTAFLTGGGGTEARQQRRGC